MRTRKGALVSAVVVLLAVCRQGGARPQGSLPIADLTSSSLNEVNAALLPLGSRRSNPTDDDISLQFTGGSPTGEILSVDSPSTDDVQFRINGPTLPTEVAGLPGTTRNADKVQFTFPDPSASGVGSGVGLAAVPGKGRAFPQEGSAGGRDLSYDYSVPSTASSSFDVSIPKLGGGGDFGQFSGSVSTSFGSGNKFGGSGPDQFEGSTSSQFGGGDLTQFGGSGLDQFGGSSSTQFGGSGSSQFGGSGSSQFGGSGSSQFGGSAATQFGGSGSDQFGGSGSDQFGGSGLDQFGGSDSTQFGGSVSNQFGGSGSDQFGGSSSSQFGGSGSDQFGGSGSRQFGGSGSAQFGGSDSAQFGGSGSAQLGGSGSSPFGGSGSTQFGGSVSAQFGGSDSTQLGGSGLTQFGGSGSTQFGGSGSTQFGGFGSDQLGGSDSAQFGGSGSDQFGGSAPSQFGGVEFNQFGGGSTSQFGRDKPQAGTLPSLSSSSDFNVKIPDDVLDSLPDRTLGDGNQKIFNNRHSPSGLLSLFLPGHKTQHHSNHRGSNPIGDILALGAGPIKKIFNLFTSGSSDSNSHSNPIKELLAPLSLGLLRGGNQGGLPGLDLSVIGLGDDAIGELVQVASSGLDDLARETSAGIRLAQDEVRFQANEKVRQFINNLLQTGRTAGTIGQNTYRALLQKKDALAKLLVGVVTNLGRYINTSVGDTFEKVGDTANIFGKFFNDLKVGLLNSLIAKGENVRELVSGTVGTVGSAFKDFTSAAQSAAEDNIRAITGLKEKKVR
ncbi:uncharacterized PE-PGRS family protein PE_PGRS24-like [Palaemon carinicauda]|uniref:uncharacterized PE-PGRS family protein PE_PGRS24-like n=1 Tax=Palaemon carinicauda TaxID=392227 RepID=UPI0035B57F47